MPRFFAEHALLSEDSSHWDVFEANGNAFSRNFSSFTRDYHKVIEAIGDRQSLLCFGFGVCAPTTLASNAKWYQCLLAYNRESKMPKRAKSRMLVLVLE